MTTLILSRNPQFLLLLARLYLLIVIFSPLATPLNFSFSSFHGDDSTLHPEGNASISNAAIYLTQGEVDQSKNESVGRVTYRTPFLLRENATGKLADFTTNFTFSITEVGSSWPADGLAFFLSPNGSKLNEAIGSGASLGLPFNGTADNNFTKARSEYPFVAVEFDIFRNDYAPIYDDNDHHVGIDVNSLNSSITEKSWMGHDTDGGITNACITYNSTSKNLSVTFTYFVNGTQKTGNISHNVDLKQYLPDWVIVGFCASTGDSIALHKIISWSFASTPLTDQPKSRKSNLGIAVGLGVGGSTLVVGLVLVWFILWKKKESLESDEDPMISDTIDDEFVRGTGPRQFSYGVLVRATSNFMEGQKLGQGGFGGVYSGFIQELNSYVAVKRISRGSKQGLREYATEVKIISRLRHRNLVQLIGWCHKKQDLLLVYEFMPNRSLDVHLFGKESLLTWEARYRIAQGLASALLYLHQEWDQCVLHRDIKSSNVMLDSNFNAKLGDFGLARLVDHGKHSQTTVQLAGTMGYMAPEYMKSGKASRETDVYSFGVVALEIACGRIPIDPKLDTSDQIDIVEWVWKLYGEGKVKEAADAKLCGDFDEKQIECLLIIGLWCAHPDDTMRPSIQLAIQVLNFEVPLPILPLKMPVATYFAPPVSFSLLSDNSTGFGGGQSDSSR